MATPIEPKCFTRRCKHYIGFKGSEEEMKLICKAFPDGVPIEIGYGNNLHLKPYSGDHGIQYEKEK